MEGNDFCCRRFVAFTLEGKFAENILAQRDIVI